MDVNYFRTLYDYNYWANERILRAAERGGDIQFITPAQYGRSVRDIMVHVLSAEWIWLARWKGVSPTSMLAEADFPTIDSVRARGRQEQAKMEPFLAGLADGDLARIVHYKNTHGEEREYPLWLMMAHVVNHGTQHRSEAAAILTGFLYSPGDLDLVGRVYQPRY